MQAASAPHIPDYLPDVPEARRWWVLPRPLGQFIVLSVLLHTLAVILFGAPTGGSSAGRAMWGSLQVALRTVPPEPGPELKLDRTLPTLSVPALAPPPSPPPPAEKAESMAIPPMLDRIITPERELRPPDFQIPLPNEAPPAPLPQVAPPVAPLPVERAAPPRIETPPPRIETPPPRVETPPPRVETPPPRVEAPPVPAPAIPRVAPLAAPAEPSLKELPPLPAPVLAAPKLDALPVVPLPTMRAPVEVPAIPLAPVVPITVPQAFDRLPAGAAPSALKDLPAVERIAPIQTEAIPSVQSSPFGLPDSSSESRFRNAQPPAEDPTKAFDMDAMRRRAGQIAREASGRKPALPFPMPAVPEKKSQLEAAIENARKPDCKTAYKDLLFLAAIPLIMNEFGEGNCRW